MNFDDYPDFVTGKDNPAKYRIRHTKRAFSGRDNEEPFVEYK